MTQVPGGQRDGTTNPGGRPDLGREYLDRIGALGVTPGELIAEAAKSDLLAVAYRGRFLPRPVFLEPDQRRGLAADLLATHRLLESLPDRLFDGSRTAMGRAVGMTTAQVTAVERGAGQTLTPLARADLYQAADGYKLLELNITSALGGFENADINRAMLHHPALRDFVDENDLDFVDTFRAMMTTMLTECADHVTGDRPVVALADWPASFRTYEPRLRVMARLLADLGVDAIPCHVGQIRQRDGRLEVAGQVIDVVYRFFMVEEIVTAEDLALVDPVLRAVERGTVAMFSKLDAELFGNKGALAMLSDDRHRSAFTADEVALVDRFLPWTRHVRRTGTDPAGVEVDLMAHAMDQRGELILKPTLLHGGSGIVAGWTVTADEWARALARAIDGPYVLQRRVHPIGEPFRLPEGTVDLYLNWGVFLIDPKVTGADGYGGCIVRGTTDPETGVVSMGSGAQVGCCFHRR